MARNLSQQLCQIAFDKAVESIDTEDFEAVYSLAKTIKMLEVEPIQGTDSKPPKDQLAAIDHVLMGHGYDDDDWKYLRRDWLTTYDAGTFMGIPADSIRNYCRNGSVLCKLDETKKRKVWLVCPRSLALFINRERDPRLVQP